LKRSFPSAFNESKNDLGLGEIDYTINPPLHILGIESGIGERTEYFSTIYPEAILSAKLPVDFEGGKKAQIQNLRSNDIVTNKVSITPQTLKLAGKGYATKSFNFDYVKALRTNAFAQKIFVLEVADSIGAQNGRFYNGSGGTRINFAVQMSKIDNKDISDLDINSKIYYGLTGGMIDIKAIGTLNKCEENFSYKSSNLTALSYNEARRMEYLWFPTLAKSCKNRPCKYGSRGNVLYAWTCHKDPI
jgi:hypothetical protein